MKSKISIWFTVLALALVSCLKNEIVYNTDDIDFRGWSFAAPIARVHAPAYESMKKWVDFDSITYNSEGVICVVYTHSEKINWNDQISIDDYRSQGWKYDLKPTTLTETYPIRLTTSDGEPDSYVDYAKLTGGKLDLSFNVPGGISWEVEVTIPELKKNGVPFRSTFNRMMTGINLSSLDGYEINTVSKNMNMKCTFTGSSASGTVNMNFNLSDLDVQYMTGYFGQPKQHLDNTKMDFNFSYDLDFLGSFGFKDLELKAELLNPVGVPANLKANSIRFANGYGLNQKVNTDPPLNFNVNAAGGDIYHVIPVNNLLKTKLSLEFEQANYPEMLILDLEGTANPAGECPNFIVNDEELYTKVDLTLTIPLHVYVNNFHRKDTVDFDYNDLVNGYDKHVKNIEKFTIKLTVDNRLPFDVQLTTDAIDGALNNVEKEFAKATIEAKKDKQVVIITLTQKQIENFRTKNVKYLVFHSNAQTEKKEYKKVYKDDYLDINVSVSF